MLTDEYGSTTVLRDLQVRARPLDLRLRDFSTGDDEGGHLKANDGAIRGGERNPMAGLMEAPRSGDRARTMVILRPHINADLTSYCATGRDLQFHETGLC